MAPNPTDSYSYLNYQFLASIDTSVAAPSVCFDTTNVSFGTIQVGTTTTSTVNVTNCGNANLTLSGANSSSSQVTVSNNCSGIAPGAVCQLQLAYTPTDETVTQGTLTVTGNMSVPSQQIFFAGYGGEPGIFLPVSISFSDLMVGQTGAVSSFLIDNTGTTPLVLASATVTGDFQIAVNNCTTPVSPGGTCELVLNFSPTAAGTRIGTLTLTDNVSPGVQTVQLVGQGLTTAPIPVITSVMALPQLSSGTGQLVVTGTGFLPNSTLYWNGSALTTTYGAETLLAASVPASDLQQVGEAAITVTTPAPGGGTSAPAVATIYGRMQNLSVLHEVYDPSTQLLYATIAANSQQYANSLVAIDPVKMQVINTLIAGSNPDVLAISSDQSLLYVGLDGTGSVAQLSLPSGTINFTLPLPIPSSAPYGTTAITASALAVITGAPHSWIVGLCSVNVFPCGAGIAVFDDSTQRTNAAAAFALTANSFAFVNDPATVYSTEFNISPPSINSFAITSSGTSLTATSAFNAAAGGGVLASDGKYLYVSNGQVIDPSTLTVKFIYPQGGTAFALDAANQRLFFAGDAYQLSLTAVDLNSQATIGSLNFYEYGDPVDVQRFGTRGIVINQGQELLFLQTSLVTGSTPASGLTASPLTLNFSSQTQGTTSAAQTVTLSNPSSAAINLGAIAATGDFAQTNNCGTSVAAGSSCQLNVTFTPTATGSRTGQLTIVESQSAATLVVALAGTGAAPPPPPTYAASASPASLSFGTQAISTSSTSQSVTLTNTGSGVLSIISIVASGDFAQTNNCGTALAANASCTIGVTFNPSTTGDRTGALTISDNATAGPQTVALSGTGASSLSLGASANGGNSVTVTAGSPATYNLTLASVDYSGSITFTCIGAPQNASCSVTPATTTIAAGHTVSASVTVTTGTTQTAALSSSTNLRLAGLGVLTLITVPLLFGIRRRACRVGVLCLLGVVFAGTGCGGGGSTLSTSGSTGSSSQNTPSGTYTLSVTATGSGFTSTTNLTLIVK